MASLHACKKDLPSASLECHWLARFVDEKDGTGPPNAAASGCARTLGRATATSAVLSSLGHAVTAAFHNQRVWGFCHLAQA